MTTPVREMPPTEGVPAATGGVARLLWGRGLILLAAVLWSTSGLFAKAPLVSTWSPDQRGILLGFWRAVFAAALLMPFTWHTFAKRVGLTVVDQPMSRWSWRLLPVCISFAVMNGSFLLAMTHTSAANAIWLQYTAPAWVLLVGVVLFGERIGRFDWWMVLLAMSGVVTILAGNISQGSGDHPLMVGGEPFVDIGLVWGLISGMGFAGVVLGLRRLSDLPTTWVVAICHASAACLLAPWVWQIPHDEMTLGTFGWFAAFGALQMALPYVLFTRGLRDVTGHEASCITLLEPLLVPCWVWLAYGNAAGDATGGIWTSCGAMLILTGLTVRYVGIIPWGGKQTNGIASDA